MKWHAEDCPLFEIAEHDCAYDLTLCDCGYVSPDDADDAGEDCP